ncbi:nonsense-mediated mRNA decay factor SMG8 isoform X1 [Episyrphus balteatus]|uniref:nonsense-mediated mRNA decay factor SMG8 isoform X1 n=1 Tax=Episyrphus balteatus TaxID=286459 RepID=UPI002484FE23|nr:nonsense-mediated mRNA decay factor SMG8 isoform X1 [Episyrphus balteatus]
MSYFETWVYPNNPPEACGSLFEDNRKLVLVGIIGKSAFPDCNKMAGLNVMDTHPSHLNHECKEGQIRFYYTDSEDILFLHFQTTFDEFCMRGAMLKEMKNLQSGRHLSFQQYVRNRFARMLLFATQVCHIVVFVELGVSFDASLISIFKSLKLIRERYVLKFLPKLLKNSNANTYFGKCPRFCSPRCLFFFENYPDGYDTTEECISKFEFEIEDNIYKMFRSELIIPNKSGTCLFALPGNKRFVYYNTDTKIREDPLLKSLNDLQRSFKTNNYFKEDNMSNMEDLRLFGSFGIPLVQNVDAHFKVETPKRNTFMNFLKDHIKEALQFGFNDGVSKFKSKSNFLVPNVKTCYETFKLLHNIFIDNADNPDYEPADPFYKSYLENFDKLMDIDEGFFSKCCDNGVKKACNLYNNAIIKHCGKSFQKALIDDSLSIYVAHARGPNIDKSEQKLIENFDPCWMKEKQYESLSNRAKNSNITKPNRGNSNNEILASTCSCKRIQCSRRGPYVMGQEIYEFLQTLQDVCRFCVKNKKTELFH